MVRKMDKEYRDIPLSESNVSLRLADIQRRCSEFITEPGTMTELSLEEPPIEPDNNNPYNRG